MARMWRQIRSDAIGAWLTAGSQFLRHYDTKSRKHIFDRPQQAIIIDEAVLILFDVIRYVSDFTGLVPAGNLVPKYRD